MALIDHWNNPDTDGLQPFFCQRDAVETVIFLTEALDERRGPFVGQLDGINARHNGGIPRTALKLATGTGKTMVMAMLMLWLAKTGRCRDFVIFVPNLTIRDRLAEIRSGKEIYDALRPKGDRTRFRVTITNFQEWQRRSGIGIDGTMTKEQMKAMGLDVEHYSQATTESEDEMIDRLLAAHRSGGALCVMNDEAHHCYDGACARGEQIDDESEAEEKRDMMWFGALRLLHERGRLMQVYDLSATPMWLRKPSVKEPSVLFPWTVSDYPLVDAIEAGLVKIPRVPIRDESGEDEPAFRNLHTTVAEALDNTVLPAKGRPLPNTIEDALSRMVADYERTCEQYAAHGIVPMLIVVADTTQNADRLFAELGGWRHDGNWVPGRFPVLSNIDVDTGCIKAHPPTLLVHSRMDESDTDTGLAGKMTESDNAAVHIADEDLSAKQRMDRIRDLFNTAGQAGKPGERLRCIVSVGMLTEGWDAKTVTHVVGYRNFGSDLLCEQVAGRALRRSVAPEPGGQLSIEYANIIGIPFHYMQAQEKGDPGDPRDPWTVYAVPGRAELRMELPRITGWRRDRQDPKAVLRTPLEPMPKLPDQHDTGMVDLAGETGAERRLGVDTREQTAVWKLAERVRIRWQADHKSDAFVSEGCRLESYASLVRATESWLALRGLCACRLTTDANIAAASADIVKHIDWTTPGERIVAIMDDPAWATTEGQFFKTKLLRYPREGQPGDDEAVLVRSELNAAACHSEFERYVASLLEQQPGVDAWVRNFRLEWTIPWYDPIHGRWHEYEPDFVVRVPRGAGAKPSGYLIIEVKGERDLASDEKMRAAQTWCERVSDGAVFATEAAGVRSGLWAYLLIEDRDKAGTEILGAVNSLRMN